MKTAVKVTVPSKKTNNQASFGGSILKNNMEVEAAMDSELQQHLDESGVPRHQVYTSLYQIYTEITNQPGYFLGKTPGWKNINFLLTLYKPM